MILTGAGIIDSQKQASLPAEIVVGTISGIPNKILYSSVNDGSAWSRYNSSFYTNASIEQVIYANGLWVAVGSFIGLQSTAPVTYWSIAYSVNGSDWTLTNPSSVNVVLYRVAWSGSKFLAIGAGGLGDYYSSIDGIIWVKELGLNSLLVSLYSVTYFNGNWYVSGQDGSSIGKIYRSADGVSWSLVFTYTPGQVALTALATNGTILTVQASFINEAWWSTNGTTWTKGTTSTGQGSLSNTKATCFWAGAPLNRFFLGGFNAGATSTKMRTSTDGKAWTSVDTSTILGSSGNTSAYISSFAWDGTNLWFTRYGTAGTGFRGVLFKSTNGTTFQEVLNNTSFTSLGYNITTVAIKP